MIVRLEAAKHVIKSWNKQLCCSSKAYLKKWETKYVDSVLYKYITYCVMHLMKTRKYDKYKSITTCYT
jgi:hypothetical protein